jgi:hypothetical protein
LGAAFFEALFAAEALVVVFFVVAIINLDLITNDELQITYLHYAAYGLMQ